jgi:hypothetical protein
MAALKVAGSQLSTNAILGALLLTWAVATFVQVTHKPTNTASPLAKIANFCMVLSSSFLAKDFYFGLVGRVDPAVAANAGRVGRSVGRVNG